MVQKVLACITNFKMVRVAFAALPAELFVPLQLLCQLLRKLNIIKPNPLAFARIYNNTQEGLTASLAELFAPPPPELDNSRSTILC